MNELNPDVLERVRSLPPKQQKRFDEMIADGAGSPREYAEQLRKDILAGEVDPNFSMATQYAIVALSDAKTPPRFESDAEAIKTYKSEAERLHEEGNENAAAYLESIVEKVMVKENQVVDRAEAVRTSAQEQAAAHQEQVETAFKKQYDEIRRQRIDLLTEWDRMSVEDATAQFMSLEHNTLVTSLRNAHGLAQ